MQLAERNIPFEGKRARVLDKVRLDHRLHCEELYADDSQPGTVFRCSVDDNNSGPEGLGSLSSGPRVETMRTKLAGHLS
nr:hypothetical protein CFP56_00262 [Quercus suber]